MWDRCPRFLQNLGGVLGSVVGIVGSESDEFCDWEGIRLWELCSSILGVLVVGAMGKAPSPLKALPVAEERPCLHGLQCPLQPETSSQGVDHTRAAQGSRGPGAGQGPADEAGRQEGVSGYLASTLTRTSGPFCPGQQDTDRPSRSGPTLVWGAASMDTRQPWGRLREC